MKPLKWLVIGVGTVVGVAHIGVLGHVMTAMKPAEVPLPPVNDYSSYRIIVTPDGGYQIEYIGNDPKILQNDTDIDRQPGFFGFGGSNRTTTGCRKRLASRRRRSMRFTGAGLTRLTQWSSTRAR